jgi:hypothetical protein
VTRYARIDVELAGMPAFAWGSWPGVSRVQAPGFSRTISAFSAVAKTVQPA